MSKRPLLQTPGPTLPFFVPNIQGKKFRPGRQPYSPGESQIDGQQVPYFRNIPWPRPVASLVALANHPGIPRGRALQISNNSDAVMPGNYLYLAGTAAKSRS